MGVLNVTPDSFSDGGRFREPESAVEAGVSMLHEGADLLDVGGESTRPGARPVAPAEQIRRVTPVISGLRRAGIQSPIGVDTTSAEVARAAFDAGADIVNDVSAGLDDPQMFDCVAARGMGLVLMHRLVSPERDSYSTAYSAEPMYPAGVVLEVRAALEARVDAAERAGVSRDTIAIDPGLGFGKSVAQNLELIARVGECAPAGLPIVAGASRKSFLGALTGQADPALRDAGSIAAGVALALAGAHIIRAHEIAGHALALAVVAGIRAASVTRGEPPASRL